MIGKRGYSTIKYISLILVLVLSAVFVYGQFETSLNIWDDSDNDVRYPMNITMFYANYTNVTGGIINFENPTTCNLTVYPESGNPGPTQPIPMYYNPGISLYFYNTTFDPSGINFGAGIHNYSVSCLQSPFNPAFAQDEVNISAMNGGMVDLVKTPLNTTSIVAGDIVPFKINASCQSCNYIAYSLFDEYNTTVLQYNSSYPEGIVNVTEGSVEWIVNVTSSQDTIVYVNFTAIMNVDTVNNVFLEDPNAAEEDPAIAVGNASISIFMGGESPEIYPNLMSPANGYIGDNKSNITFIYNVSSSLDGEFKVNCTLWWNLSGSWMAAGSLVHTLLDANNSIESVANWTVPVSNLGTYIWNVECLPSTGDGAPANFDDAGNRSFSVIPYVDNTVNVTIKKTALTPNVNIGDTVEFLINVTNNGAQVLNGYTVYDTYDGIPSGKLDFDNEVSVSTSRYNETDNDIEWLIDVAAGESFLIYVNFTANASGTTWNNVEFQNSSEYTFAQDNETVTINSASGCIDSDNDGYNASSNLTTCGPIDCNDNNNQVYPTKAENCADGIDNNCDYLVDIDDGSCIGAILPDWDIVDFMKPPYASNGPGCYSAGETFNNAVVEGQNCPGSSSTYDMGAVWVDQDKNFVYWQIFAPNMNNSRLCGGDENLRIFVEFDVDANKSTGCTNCYEGADYQFILNLDGFGEMWVYNNTYCPNLYPNTTNNANKYCFDYDSGIPVYVNVSKTNGVCNSYPTEIKVAVRKNSIENITGMNFEVNTFNEKNAEQGGGPFDQLRGGDDIDPFMGAGPKDKGMDCMQFDNDQTQCTNSTDDFYCRWDSNFNICEPDFDNFNDCDSACFACSNQTACDNSNQGICNWKTGTPIGDICVEEFNPFEFGGNCDSNCFDCFSQKACQNSEANGANTGYGGCGWFTDPFTNFSFCEVNTFQIPKCQNRSVDGKDNWEGCINQNDCEAKGWYWDSSIYLCNKNSTYEVCFDGIDNDGDGNLDCNDDDCYTEAFCGGTMDTLTGQYAGLDPKEALKNQMKEGMGNNQPVVFAYDVEADTSVSYADIDSLGVKEGETGLYFGTKLFDGSGVNLNDGICNKGGSNSLKLLAFFDVDDNTNTGCDFVADSTTHSGYEYVVRLDINGQPIVSSLKCIDNNGWILNGMRSSTQSDVFCDSDVLVTMVQKSDIGNPTGVINVHTMTLNTSWNNLTNLDIFDEIEGYYTPGSVGFEPIDCFADPSKCGAAFGLVGNGKYMPFEDCMMPGDEDLDGAADCNDTDCIYAPWCSGNYNQSADKTAPRTTLSNVEKFNDAAFVAWSTNEPTNSSLLFYKTDSNCLTLNATLIEPNPQGFDPFKPWHNFVLDTYELGYPFADATSYYYKIKNVDKAGNVGQSKCLNFTTLNYNKNVTLLFNHTQGSNNYTDNMTVTINNQELTFGNTNKFNFTKDTNLTFKGFLPDQSGNYWEIKFVNADITKAASLDLGSDMLINFSAGDYVIGMSNGLWLEIAQKLGCDSIIVRFPTTSDNLYKCDDSGTNCQSLSTGATLLSSGGTDPSAWSYWQIPVTYGFSTYTVQSGNNENASVTKTAVISSVTVGDTASFILNVTNTGTANITNYQLTDRFNISYINYTTSSHTPNDIRYNDGEVEWLINLSVGSSELIYVNFTTYIVGDTVNLVDLANASDFEFSRDNASLTIQTLPVANLSVVKTALDAASYAGDTVRYLLNVTNVGVVNATNYRLEDTYDNNLDFNDNVSITYDDFNETTNTIMWNFNVSVGESYLVYVNFTATIKGTATNNITVKNSSDDIIGSSNTATTIYEDDYEDNDVYTDANWITTDGTKQNHNFRPAADNDWIKFNATSGMKYVIETFDLVGSTDTTINLTDSGLNQLDYNDDILPNGVGYIRRSKIDWTATSTGTFYVKIKDYNSAFVGGGYNVSITQIDGINLTLISPTNNTNLQIYDTFNVTVNVTCTGTCNNISVYLDPYEKKNNVNNAPVDDLRNKVLTEEVYDVIINLKDVDNVKSSGYGVQSVKQLSRKEKVNTKQNSVLDSLNPPSKGYGALSTPKFNVKRKYAMVGALSGRITKEGIESLRNNPDVESVEIDRPVKAALNTAVPLVNANDVWQQQPNGINVTGVGQTVCILDTGIDYTHADFGGYGTFPNAKIIGGYDFAYDDADPADPTHGHGTHVAGIIASENSTYKGMAPDAKIVAVKVLDDNGDGLTSDVIAGIDYCVLHGEEYNISVISMSLGGGNSTTTCDSSSDAKAVNYANDLGYIVSVATGNDGFTDRISYPSCASGAFKITSSTKIDTVSSFSNRASGLVDLIAPGGTTGGTGSCPDANRICSTNNGGGHISMSGTSMATPMVSGAVLLLNQYYNLNDGLRLHNGDIKSALTSTSTKIEDLASGTNYTRLDVLEAFNQPLNKGIISTVVGATPFYTTSDNPQVVSITSGQTTTLTWEVNTTGSFGNYNFFAFTNQEEEVQSNQFIYTIYDNIKPVVNLVSPADLSHSSSSSVSFVFDVTDTTDTTSNCSLYINDQLNQTNESVSVDVQSSFDATLADGIYSWYITCLDSYGLSNTSETRNVTVDTASPSVELLTPVNNTILGTSSVSFAFNVTDITDSTSNCSLYIDGQLNQTNESVNVGVSTLFDVTLSDSTFSWYITCKDVTANSGTSEIRSIAVDTQAPQVTLQTPANGLNTSSNTMTFEGIVTDNYNYANTCNITINGVSSLLGSSFTNGSTVNLTNYDISAMSGDINWNMTCVDQASNTGTSATRIFNIDRVAPSIYAGGYNDTTVGLSKSILIYANVTDNELVKNVSAQYGSNTVYSMIASGNQYSVATTASDLGITETGTHDVVITTYDYAGNSNTTNVSVSVDNSMPLVSNFVASTYYTTSTTSINFTATVVDTSIASVTMNGTSMTNSSTTYWTYNTTTQFGCSGIEGDCTFFVSAVDSVGNNNNSESVTITIDDLNPRVTGLSVSDVDSIVKSTDSITVSVTVVDANTTSVLVNGLTMSGITNYTLSTNAAALGCTTGSCSLNVTATDGVGNVNNSEKITITVDDVAPSVFAEGYNDTTVTLARSILLFANVTDSVGILNVSAQYGSNTPVVMSASDDYYSVATTATALGITGTGNHSVTITAYDNATNVNNSVIVYVDVDASIPVVSSFAATTYYTKSTTSINFTAFVNDTSLASVTMNGTTMTGTPGSTFWTYNTTAQFGCSAIEGDCTFFVSAVDSVGNNNNSESVTITIDDLNPRVTGLSVSDVDSIVKSTDSIIVRVTVVDANTTSVLVNGLTMTGTTNYTLTTNAAALGCTTGSCSLNVTATDGVGNVNNSEKITITVDDVAPSVFAEGYNDTTVTLARSILLFANVTDSVGILNVSAQYGSNTPVVMSASDDYYSVATTATALGITGTGNHSVTITAYDNATNVNNSVVVYVDVDASIPVVSSFAASTYYTTSATSINFTAFVNDTSLASVTMNGTTMTGTPGSTYWTYNTTAQFGCSGIEGDCTFFVSAVDSVGNNNNSESVTITIDDLNPRVTGLNIDDGDIIVKSTDSITVSVTVADANTTSVLVNGLTMSGTTNYTLATTANALSCGTGSCDLNITATDGVGNINNSEKITITVDDVTPSVFAEGYNDTTVTLARSILLFTNVTDSVGILNVSAQYGSNTPVVMSASGDYYSVATTATALGITGTGNHSVTITAYDNATNVNNSVVVYVDVDASIPVVSSFAATTYYTKSTTSINFTAFVNDTSLASVTMNGTTMTGVAGSTFWTYNTTAQFGCSAIEGDCTFFVSAVDSVGNNNNSESVTITIDDLNPRVTSIVSDDTDSLVNGAQSVVFTATVSDANLSTITINGTSFTGSTLTSNVTNLGCSSDGACVLTVVATDALGNVNNSETVTLTLDNTAPTINSIVIDDYYVSSTQSVSVTVNVSDVNGVYSVSAEGVNLTQSGDIWSGTLTLSDGILNIVAVDNASNSVTDSSVTYTVDDIVPVIAENSLYVGSSLLSTTPTVTSANGNFTLNWTIEEFNLTSTNISVDGGLFTTSFATNGTHSYTVSLDAGTHTVVFAAVDEAGNTLTTSTYSFKVNALVNTTEVTTRLNSTSGDVTSIKFEDVNGSDISNNVTYMNKTLKLKINVSVDNDTSEVLIPDFDGLDANWNQTFTVNNSKPQASSTAVGILGTNVTKMVFISGFENFLARNTYTYGQIIFKVNVESLGYDVVYYADDEGNNATIVTQNSCTGTYPCYFVNSTTNWTYVRIPHFSGAALALDTIAPNLNLNYPQNNSLYTYSYGINITGTVNETNVPVNIDTMCWYKIDSGTASYFDLSGSGPSYSISETINSLITDGQHNFTFNCTDSKGNTRYYFYNVTVSDSVAPVITTPSDSVSSSSATITYTVDEPANYTIMYGTNVNLTSNTSVATLVQGSTSISLSGLSASTLYYYNITVCDTNNNCNTNGMYNLTTSAAASPSGGGSGGGGSSSTTTTITTSPGETITHTWTKAIPGTKSSVSIVNDNIAINKITFDVKEQVSNPKVYVVDLYSKPPSTTSIANQVYKYLEIQFENLVNTNVKDAVISFKVEKSWLQGKDLSKVRLMRYTGKWDELATLQSTEDDKYIYFNALTPGFSYFAIVVKDDVIPTLITKPVDKPTVDVPLSEEEKVIPKTNIEEQTEEKVQEEQVKDDNKAKGLLGFVLFLVLLYFIMQKVVKPPESKRR